jgi:hypothetical protein
VVAHFDGAIPPGGEGKIVLSIGSKSCTSGSVKQTLVRCNDPMNSVFVLTIKGKSTL